MYVSARDRKAFGIFTISQVLNLSNNVFFVLISINITPAVRRSPLLNNKQTGARQTVACALLTSGSIVSHVDA